MTQNSQFEVLSSQLTTQERQQMLASIRKSMEAQAAPIVPEIDPPPPPAEVQMQTLGLWQRLRLFLAQVFTGRAKEEVLQEWVMRSLQEQLTKANVDGIDAKTGQFKEAFARDIEELKRAALTLFPVVEIASRRRTELVLALAMHNFPGIHRELVRKTGEEHVRSIEEESERYLKRRLNGTLDDMLADVPTNSRGAVKSALDQADTLYRLASFSFGGVLGSFEGVGQETGRHCAFDYVIRNIETLDQTLAALTRPVDLALLEALVMLTPREADNAGTMRNGPDGETDEEAFQQQIRDGLSALTAALGRFRTFAGTYPLTLIVRIVKEDPWWMPRIEQSGEDWSLLYRSFFTDRIHRIVLRVSLESQVKKHLATLGDTAGSVPEPIAGLPGIASTITSRAWYRGVALKTLGGTLWRTVLPRLKIVLTSGEFYKSSNRAQFNDAYNEFEQIPNRIGEFEDHLSPEGSWGSVLAAGAGTEDVGADAGETAPTGRGGIVARADQELEKLADTAHTTVEMLVNVLGGILYARPGSSYDTLANYGQIGGRRNAEFIDELKETHANLHAWLTVFEELRTLEKRAVENEIVLNTDLARRAE